MRVSTLYDLTIQLQYQTQNAVRSRMLRAKVQREIANVSHAPDPHKYLRARCAGDFPEARWSRVGKSPEPDPGRSASRHNPGGGSPCGTHDQQSSRHSRGDA